MPVTVGPSTVTINHDRQFLICQRDATIAPTGDLGFYARDTRVVSGYAVTINGRAPLLLDAIAVEPFSARHEFMTPALSLSPGAALVRDREENVYLALALRNVGAGLAVIHGWRPHAGRDGDPHGTQDGDFGAGHLGDEAAGRRQAAPGRARPSFAAAGSRAGRVGGQGAGRQS